MKKTIIVVVIVAVVLLIGFIALGNFKKSLPSDIAATRAKAEQASLKAFAAQTMGSLAQYYSTNQTVNFSVNPQIKQSLDTQSSQLGQQYSGTVVYKIYESSNATSVKVGDTTAGIYECIDSGTVQVSDITADQLNQSTDCSGKVIQ